MLACPLAVERYVNHCESRFIHQFIHKISTGYFGEHLLSIFTLTERWPVRLSHSLR